MAALQAGRVVALNAHSKGVGNAIVLPSLLLFQAVEAGLRTRMKHTAPKGWLSEQFIPARERDIWSWFHWDYDRRLGSIEGMGEHLRSLGIERTDRVISVPDPSPNITLSLMDVRGFTDLYDDGLVRRRAD